MHAVEVDGLVKRFGEVVALDHLDLVVPRGTVFGLLGPNGAGKTTAVRILATLLAPTSGAARVLGHDVTREPHAVRGLIGLTGQFAAVDEELTGRENLRLVGRLLDLDDRGARARADELLERFDLVDASDRPAKAYSGGMRRRLDVAVSLVGQPPVLFLDEPTTGLDPRSRLAVWSVIRELVEEGITLLLTTQYLEEADQLAGTIAVIDHGRVIAQGSADELKRQVGGQVVEVRPADPARLDELAELLGELTGERPLVDRATRKVSVSAPEGLDVVGALAHRLKRSSIPIADLSLRRPSLDEVFLQVTGQPPTAEDEGEPADGRDQTDATQASSRGPA